MTWQDILGFSVIGAIVTTTGTLIGLVLKERLFARSFERWKTRLSLEQIARRYREPIALTALELCNRLSEVCEQYPPDFLDSSILAVSAPHRPTLNSAADPYFRRYKLVSSVYRLCAFLGWIELYRQETTYLEPVEQSRSSDVERAIFALRADLADGQLNTAEDWASWHDALIFREEQRAIGESMIVTVGQVRTIMGYAEFSESFPGSGENSRQRWFTRAAAFLLDPQPSKDFRRVRLQRMVVHLTNLAELLAPNRLRQEHRDSRAKYSAVENVGTAA
jgi:hypothetical protein